jgi:hypothetical protein
VPSQRGSDVVSASAGAGLQDDCRLSPRQRGGDCRGEAALSVLAYNIIRAINLAGADTYGQDSPDRRPPLTLTKKRPRKPGASDFSRSLREAAFFLPGPSGLGQPAERVRTPAFCRDRRSNAAGRWRPGRSAAKGPAADRDHALDFGFARDFGPMRIGDDEAPLRGASSRRAWSLKNPSEFRPESRGADVLMGCPAPLPGIDVPT